MKISDYVFLGLINRLGKINRYTMFHSVKLKFEIDDTVDKLSLKTILEKEEMSADNLFVVCNIVKRESLIYTLQVAFDISPTDSKLNFFGFESFFLLYGEVSEILDATLPIDDGVIGRVLISPKILIRKLMENPLGMLLSSKYFSKVHDHLPKEDVLTTRITSRRIKKSTDENIKVLELNNSFEYSNENIKDLCRRFNKTSENCVLRLNCEITARYVGTFQPNIVYITTPNLEGVFERSDVKVLLTINIEMLRRDPDLYRHIANISEKFPNTLSLKLVPNRGDRLPDCNEEHFKQIMTPLSNLNKLSLSLIRIPFKPFVEYMKTVPCLTELRLHNVTLQSDTETNFYEDFNESMKNVVTFEIRERLLIQTSEIFTQSLVYNDRFWEVLANLPKLKSLYLCDFHLPVEPDSFRDDPQHPQYEEKTEEEEEEGYEPYSLGQIGTGLSSLRQLTFLSLSYCHYTARSISELLGPVLVNLQNLKTLDLSNTEMSSNDPEDSELGDMIGAFIPILQKLPNLRVLDVCNNPLLDEDDIKRLKFMKQILVLHGFKE